MYQELRDWVGLLPGEFWLGGVLATTAVLSILWMVLTIKRWNESRMLRRRSQRAFRGEERAERVLRRAGFIPIESQVEGGWSIYVDGEELEVQLFADWIVEEGDLRYLVEVKTGRRAPSIRNSATRRQLLEYYLAFDVDGVLLLNMETEEIQEVYFPLESENQG